MGVVLFGAINVPHYSAYKYDDIFDDVLFNIFADARLVLSGDDQFQNGTIAGVGQVRVRGPLEIDGLTLENAVTLVNSATVTQTGDFALGVSDDDTVVVRNLPGATWDVAGSAQISQAGANSRFVNFGLFEQAGAADAVSVGANFISRGDVQVEGTINFNGASTRFFGAVSAGSMSAEALFLDGAVVSSHFFEAQSAIVEDTASLTSAIAYFGNLHLLGGAKLEFDGASQTVGLGAVSGNGEIDLTGSVGLSTFPVGSMTLTGNLKLVNSGNLHLHSLLILRTSFTSASVTATPSNGGVVEIDNLAGATWATGTPATSFIGDGTDRSFFHNSGTFQLGAVAAGQSLGSVIFNMNVINDGVFKAGSTTGDTSTPLVPNSLIFDNVVAGAGAIEVGANGVTFKVSVAPGQTIVFTPAQAPTGYAPPTLALNDIPDFAAVVSGFDQNGATDDQIVANTAVWQFLDFAPNPGGTGGALIFSDGAAQAPISLAGTYDPTKFHAAVSGSQTTITYG